MDDEDSIGDLTGAVDAARSTWAALNKVRAPALPHEPLRPLSLFADPGPDGVILHAIELEYRCGTCRAAGRTRGAGGEYERNLCAICDGRGFLLTQNGAALLALVREWEGAQ